MESKDRKVLSDFLAVMVIILVIAALIAYFYQISYVTLLGTFYDYPYRGYVLGMVVGMVFCLIGSFAANHIGYNIHQSELRTLTLATSQRYCKFCGEEVPLNANYCPFCARRLK